MQEQQKSALLTGGKMMVAGALAFCVSQLFSWAYGFWVVVTVAAVTRPGVVNTLGKVITRVIGTVIGGILAYVTLVLFGPNPLLVIICFFFIIAASSYIGLQSTILSYGGIIIGLTMAMVISMGLLNNKPFETMIYRIMDVVIGVGCITIVNILLRWFFPKKEAVVKTLGASFQQAYAQLVNWQANKNLVKASIVSALATSITFLPWLYWHFSGGFWATISCFVIMEESKAGTCRKGWLRFISHVIAAAVGGVSAVVIGSHTYWLLLPLMLTFFVCGYIMVRSKTFSGAGNTMAAALSIMLLAEPGTTSTLAVVETRFLSVVGGIAVGLIVISLIRQYESESMN